jgi:hypothetical protein
MGATFYVVSPTEKLLKLQDPQKSTGKFIVVPFGTMKLLEVLKEEDYKSPTPLGGAGDQFRLVLGTVHAEPSAQALTLGKSYGGIEPNDLKFRAVLQFNPFAKTYTYITADLGNLKDPGWYSQNVK